MTRRVSPPPCPFEQPFLMWQGGYLLSLSHHTLIFDATGRVSTLLITLFTHFRHGKEGETLVVTSKPNPPNPGHGYGFRVGDFHSTHTRTRPIHTYATHTRLPAQVHKPVMGPSLEVFVKFPQVD